MSISQRASAFADATALSGADRFIKHCCVHALRQKQVNVTAEIVLRYPTLLRSATSPASTGQPGWAQELTSADITDFLASGPAPSLLARLTAIGLTIDLTGVGSARVPMPVNNVNPLAGWVGESQPIRDVSPTLSAVTLAPRKAASLSVFANELRKRAVQDAENILANLLRTDIIRTVDGSLVGTQTASGAIPAGILNGVTPLVPSSAPQAALAMVADLKALVGAVVAAGGIAPALLMSPIQAIALLALPGALAVPVLTSVAIADGIVVCLDVASFAANIGAPTVEVSEQAVIHEEDTTPLPIATGAPGAGVLATPSRSLWQTDCSGIRTLFDCAWAVAGQRIAWLAGATW